MIKATLAIIKCDNTWEPFCMALTQFPDHENWFTLKQSVEPKAWAILIEDEKEFVDICLLEIAVVRP